MFFTKEEATTMFGDGELFAYAVLAFSYLFTVLLDILTEREHTNWI